MCMGAYVTAPVNSCEVSAFGENIIRGLLFFLAHSSMLFCGEVSSLQFAVGSYQLKTKSLKKPRDL